MGMSHELAKAAQAFQHHTAGKRDPEEVAKIFEKALRGMPSNMQKIIRGLPDDMKVKFVQEAMRGLKSAGALEHELVVAARDFEATTKTASWDGPYAWMDDKMIRVWLVMESYGRVHHVTGDLTQADKVLSKARQSLVTSQTMLGDDGVFLDIGDIYINGLKGGRNRMIMEFYATITTKDPGINVEDVVADYLPRGAVWKNSPPPSS